MAVHIRLKRLGRKKRPFYRVVVMDSKTRRDGREIEKLGWYDPFKNDEKIKINEDRTMHWLKEGAKPTDTVRNLFRSIGLNLKWHLIRNNKSDAAIVKEMADWLEREGKRKELKLKKSQEKKTKKIADKGDSDKSDTSEIRSRVDTSSTIGFNYQDSFNSEFGNDNHRPRF